MVSSPLMVVPNSFAQSSSGDPMPGPEHPPDPTVHQEEDITIDKNDNVAEKVIDDAPRDASDPNSVTTGDSIAVDADDLDAQGVKIPKIVDNVELFELIDDGTSKRKIQGTLIIVGDQTDNPEGKEYECWINYVVYTVKGPAILTFKFIVTITPGTHHNIEKICYGESDDGSATVTITEFENTRIDIDVEKVQKQPQEYHQKPQETSSYDGTIYFDGPEFGR